MYLISLLTLISIINCEISDHRPPGENLLGCQEGDIDLLQLEVENKTIHVRQHEPFNISVVLKHLPHSRLDNVEVIIRIAILYVGWFNFRYLGSVTESIWGHQIIPKPWSCSPSRQTREPFNWRAVCTVSTEWGTADILIGNDILHPLLLDFISNPIPQERKNISKIPRYELFSMLD